VGTNQAAVTLARELFDRRQELGVQLVGFVDPDPSRVGTSLINPGIIGTICDIPAIVQNHAVDRVVVSLADARGKLSMDELLHMKLTAGVRFDHLASVYEQYTGKIAVENLRPSWLVFSAGFSRKPVVSALKRALDVSLAVFGLLLSFPVLVAVAVGIWLTSGRPVLYSQRRVGKNGQPFTIYKFRTMRPDAEAATGAVWSVIGDPRVTPLGRFLRRTRLDELPQLWNVLRGDMSVVGPRPERPEFVSDLSAQIPYYAQRHAVRPGVTGWAQVRHTYTSTVEDTFQKLQYDLFYVKHLSIAFDLFILLETIKTVLVRRGS
jgi:sugar transferase (PEP-CTERM system associated)